MWDITIAGELGSSGEGTTNPRNQKSMYSRVKGRGRVGMEGWRVSNTALSCPRPQQPEDAPSSDLERAQTTWPYAPCWVVEIRSND